MRQFVLLFFALLLALFGLNSLAKAESFAPYILRDGLLVSSLVMLLFAVGSTPFFANRFSLSSTNNDPGSNALTAVETIDRWGVVKTVLIVTGALCALIGWALFAIDTGADAATAADAAGADAIENGGLGLAIFAPFRLALWIIGVALFTLGMFWRTRDVYRVPDVRWVKDDSGQPIRVAADGSQLDGDSNEDAESNDAVNETAPSILWDDQYSSLVSPGLTRILLLAIVTIGAMLRYWAMKTLPADCVGTECVLMFNVLNEQGLPMRLGEAGSLFEILASLAYNFAEPGLLPLRVLSVLIGVATLLAFYGFVRGLVRPIGALAATALLAIHPWHVGASASAEGAITIPLLLSLSMWALLQALPQTHQPSARVNLWRTLAGVLMGVTLVEIMSHHGGDNFVSNLLGLFVLNLAFIALILFFAIRRWFSILWLPIGAFVALLPLLIQRLFQPTAPIDKAADAAINIASLQPLLTEMLRNLFWRGSIGSVGSLGENSLLGLLIAALVMLGLGALLRSAISSWRTPTRWPAALFVLLQLLFLGVATLLILHQTQMGGEAKEISSVLLLVLPLLFAATAAALDQLATGFAQLWQKLIHPETVAIIVILGALLLGAPRALDLLDRLGSVSQGGNAQVDSALGRYLADQLQIDSGQSRSAGANVIGTRTYFLPPRSMENPALRMLSGPQFETAVLSGQVRGFDISRDLLFVNAEGDELVYLVPANDQNLMLLLERVYPRGIPEVQLDERDGAPLFTAYRVLQQDLRESRGVRGFYFAGNQLRPNDQATTVVEGEPVDFDWLRQPPKLSAPFAARWEGTLLIPVAGDYAFYLEGEGIDDLEQPAQESAIVWLDNMRILDSSAGRMEGRQTLARGTYRIDVNFQTNRDSPGFRILWQQPNGVTGVLPQDLLQSNTIPSIGLLGTYYKNDSFSGEGDLLRKDYVLGADVALPLPYSVRWNGKLAAPRAGEYVIGAITSGALTLDVDRRTLVNTKLPAPENEDAPTAETPFNMATKALVYLERGWHDIAIEYVPEGNGRTAEGDPDIQLYWSQPGSAFSVLDSEYLAPVLASIAPTDMPLPPPSALVLPDLNADESRFAFTPIDDSYTKFSFQSVIPPSRLPPFNPNLVWQTQDGCGTLPSQFAEPRGVIMEPTSGQIFVADTGNRRVVQYDIGSNQGVRIYTSPQFEEPFDMDISTASGRSLPLVLDSISQRIYQIDPEAAPQEAITALPQEPSFYRPRGFAVDISGNIIVADTGGGRVVIMNPSGQVLVEYGGQGTMVARGQPVDVLAGARNIWLVTAEDGRLWNLRSFELQNSSMTAIQATSTLRGPRFAALPNGGFLMTDPARQQILLHGPDGQPRRQFNFGDFFRKPIGIDMNMVNGQPYMTVIDMETCVLSLWQLNMNEMN